MASIHEVDAPNVPAGWLPLLERMTSEIRGLNHPPTGVHAKEKFGKLRIYLFGEDGDARQIAKAATEASASICQCCGASGRFRNKEGIVATLCDDHA